MIIEKGRYVIMLTIHARLGFASAAVLAFIFSVSVSRAQVNERTAYIETGTTYQTSTTYERRYAPAPPQGPTVWQRPAPPAQLRNVPPAPPTHAEWQQSFGPYSGFSPQQQRAIDIAKEDATPSIGYANTILAPYSAINGGRSNNVTTEAVWGYGEVPQTERGFSTIGGGYENNASGYGGFVGGGQANRVSGYYPTVVGGSANVTRSSVGFVGGGFDNSVGGNAASIVGGRQNRNDQASSVIGGGERNTINSTPGLKRGDSQLDFYGRNAIVAGLYNVISGFTTGSVILSGSRNDLKGSWSGIGHGTDNSVSGEYAWAAGRRAAAITGSVTLTDSRGEPLASTQPDQFSTRFAGGYNLAGGDVATSASIHAESDLSTSGTLSADAIVTAGQPGLSTTVELLAPGNKVVQLTFVNGLLVQQREK